ncbi:MAG: hypothetical protein JF600_10205 [Xanthomonadales bacterium]|nr:hypothetical protein [Xanthomonadales bacterium]
MKHAIRQTRGAITAFASKARNAAGVGALALTGLAPKAFAGDLSAAFETGVDKTELLLIGGIVLAVVGIVFLISSGKRAGR